MRTSVSGAVLLVIAAVACRPAPPAVPEAADPAGTWDLERSARPGGPQLTIRIVRDTPDADLTGRLTYLMVGNVGLEPSRFRVEIVHTGDRVDVSILDAAVAEPAGLLSGWLTGDAIVLTRFEWAGRSILAAGDRLVRRDAPE